MPVAQAISLPKFPGSDRDAQRRFDAARSCDPYPEIPPALLNTADLLDYIAATGMIYPFRVSDADPSRDLKPASCAIPLLGQVVYWDETFDHKRELMVPTKVVAEINRGQPFTVKRNSIVYVTLEPTFRIPDYMAARFNLTIRDIYRGLLVGTGPLVDPGFVGRLSLPIHNLTFNDYAFQGGEPMVWMEFTKLSPNSKWDQTAPAPGTRRGTYVSFPERKLERRTVEDYVRRASSEPITSSIPRLVRQAEEAAKGAQQSASAIRRNIAVVSGIGLAALIAALVTLYVTVLGVVNDANKDRTSVSQQVTALSARLAADRQALVRHGISVP